MWPVYRWDENADPDVGRNVRCEDRAPAEARVFQSLTVSAVRAVVSRHAAKAGMDAARRSDLVLAANEIATNSVRHAGGWGLLRIWREADALICEVTDQGSGLGALPAPRRPHTDQVDGYGLWLANKLCEQVEVSTAGGGTAVRLRMPL